MKKIIMKKKKEEKREKPKHTKWRRELPGMTKSLLQPKSWWGDTPDAIRVILVIILLMGVVQTGMYIFVLIATDSATTATKLIMLGNVASFVIVCCGVRLMVHFAYHNTPLKAKNDQLTELVGQLVSMIQDGGHAEDLKFLNLVDLFDSDLDDGTPFLGSKIVNKAEDYDDETDLDAEIETEAEDETEVAVEETVSPEVSTSVAQAGVSELAVATGNTPENVTSTQSDEDVKLYTPARADNDPTIEQMYPVQGTIMSKDQVNKADTQEIPTDRVERAVRLQSEVKETPDIVETQEDSTLSENISQTEEKTTFGLSRDDVNFEANLIGIDPNLLYQTLLINGVNSFRELSPRAQQSLTKNLNCEQREAVVRWLKGVA